MPGNTIAFNTVQEIGLSLPGVEKSVAPGAPALKSITGAFRAICTGPHDEFLHLFL